MERVRAGTYQWRSDGVKTFDKGTKSQGTSHRTGADRRPTGDWQTLAVKDSLHGDQHVDLFTWPPARKEAATSAPRRSGGRKNEAPRSCALRLNAQCAPRDSRHADPFNIFHIYSNGWNCRVVPGVPLLEFLLDENIWKSSQNCLMALKFGNKYLKLNLHFNGEEKRAVKRFKLSWPRTFSLMPKFTSLWNSFIHFIIIQASFILLCIKNVINCIK